MAMAKLVKRYSVIRAEAPVPDDLTTGCALIALYGLQDWECLPQNRPDPYAPGFFYNRIPGFLHGLDNVSRTTALHHIDTKTCLVCETPIDLQRSTLDHIIPLSDGGSEALQNSLMLCRRCNSSKGTKDLLEWWLFKQYKATDLPRNVLCLYARIHWQHYGLALLQQPAPDYLLGFLSQRMALLPTDAHRIALIGAAYAGCAYRRWLEGF